MNKNFVNSAVKIFDLLEILQMQLRLLKQKFNLKRNWPKTEIWNNTTFLKPIFAWGNKKQGNGQWTWTMVNGQWTLDMYCTRNSYILHCIKYKKNFGEHVMEVPYLLVKLCVFLGESNALGRLHKLKLKKLKQRYVMAAFLQHRSPRKPYQGLQCYN